MSKIVLLDGGMGQELIHRSKLPASPLWSAHVMMNEPEIVEAVHREYIEAGATVMTLNTYSATPERLARDASADLFKPLQAKAIEIAKKAKGNTSTIIAGCLPPLFASYRPEMAPDLETCTAAYRQIVAEQKDHVDIIICETMASVKEAKAATMAGVEAGLEVWCALTLKDGEGTLLRSGEPLMDGILAAKAAGASAILVNCSWPESVSEAMPFLAKSELPFGGYANGFTSIDKLDAGGTVDGLTARTDLGPEQYSAHAMNWVKQGATIVGGCCEVGPAHIKHLHDALVVDGHQIVGTL